MSSGSGSKKYLTPCRSFGLKRIHRKTPSLTGSSSESEEGKSVNSPFTSPLLATRPRTVPSVEKKRSSSQDSLWSTPLLNKTYLKIGLSKPSGKRKSERILQPKDLLSGGTSTESPEEIHDATSKAFLRKCSEGVGVSDTILGMCVGGTPKSMLSKCHSGGDYPKALLGKCPDVGTTPKSTLVKCPKGYATPKAPHKTPKTMLGKCPDVYVTPKSMLGKCPKEDATLETSLRTPKKLLGKYLDGGSKLGKCPNEDVTTYLSLECSGVDTIPKSPKKLTDENNSPTVSHQKCPVRNIKNSFFGWDLDSEESVSLNSRLNFFKRFLENQMSTKAVALTISPSSQESSRYIDVISDAEATSEDATAISNSASLDGNSVVLLGNNVNFDGNSENVASSRDCNPHSESVCSHESEIPQAVSYESDLDRNENFPTTNLENDEDERCASQDSMLFDCDTEHETGDEWDAKVKTYPVEQSGTGKLSLKKQPALSISKRHMVDSICDRPIMMAQKINVQESSDKQVVTELEQEVRDCESGSEEVEQLKMDIRKWLEGGQRVIQEIIEEVRLQKDREMTVMEVLEEQGVDPDLVGYDPQREEFITFDKFMLNNDIS